MTVQDSTYFVYPTPHGAITIATNDEAITRVAFGDIVLEGTKKPSELSNRAANELQEYFAGKRHEFDLPLDPKGSVFQRAVWKEIEHIPYGQSMTSSEIAGILARHSAMRAVGFAARRNPIEILIPSHRVVNARGQALGVDKVSQLKFALLKFEKRNS